MEFIYKICPTCGSKGIWDRHRLKWLCINPKCLLVFDTGIKQKQEINGLKPKL